MELQYHPRGCMLAGFKSLEERTRILKEKGIATWIRPVITRNKDGIYIHYASSGGPCGVKEEDWTLPIMAELRGDNRYNICVEGRVVDKAEDAKTAIELMGRYIEEKGLLKNSE
jgi:hypothetical protein